MSQTMSLAAAKEQAKERDGYECRFCGTTNSEHKEEHGRGIHAHHIIRQSADGEDSPRNLITVCRDCHDILERTQAEALERINVTRGELEEWKEKAERRGEELEQLRGAMPDAEDIRQWMGQETVPIEVVTKTFGARSYTSSDSERAYEEYQDWGSKLSRSNVHIPDDTLAELAKRVADELEGRMR